MLSHKMDSAARLFVLVADSTSLAEQYHLTESFDSHSNFSFRLGTVETLSSSVRSCCAPTNAIAGHRVHVSTKAKCLINKSSPNISLIVIAHMVTAVHTGVLSNAASPLYPLYSLASPATIILSVQNLTPSRLLLLILQLRQPRYLFYLVLIDTIMLLCSDTTVGVLHLSTPHWSDIYCERTAVIFRNFM